MFTGRRSLVQYVVLDYTITNNTDLSSDDELVEVKIKKRGVSCSPIKRMLLFAGYHQTWSKALEPNNHHLSAHSSHMCNSVLHKLLSGKPTCVVNVLM